MAGGIREHLTYLRFECQAASLLWLAVVLKDNAGLQN
jgi:hypothetical protein